MSERQPRRRAGIQSLEHGIAMLRSLAAAGRPMMLRDLAASVGMPAAKAHGYAVSLLRTGAIAQDTSSGRYDLGPTALELGLAGLGRLDPVRLAGPVLDALCETLQETVALAVWGNRGATIVRIVDAGGPITVTLRAGTVLPLHNSATGRAFAAFHRSPYLRAFLDEELRQAAAKSRIALTALRRQLERNLVDFRERGLARATGSLTPGINGFSAPVFDHSGSMVAAITSLGPVGEFSVEWDSPAAGAMRDASTLLSQQLGYGMIQGG
ncbi:MAG: IclR family transcriptional regulator [Azonexus sp.]|nr:IclR family transcriptional regulator [Betaproteobacteria bacterium]MBK8917122.1 IclR family transcriptional regulator [Betaproteobacteria bacterium]MBP6037433.1 IclR family transcriptional regulator [Azonexus sp.]MBP6908031.1 IclR family transcriptional regulator [Azonexus sp.]